MAKKPVHELTEEDSDNGRIPAPPKSPESKDRVNLKITETGRIKFEASPETTKRILKWLYWAIGAATLGYLSTLLP